VFQSVSVPQRRRKAESALREKQATATGAYVCVSLKWMRVTKYKIIQEDKSL